MNTTAPNLKAIGPLKFFREVKMELSKVTWPTRADTVKLTGVVILVSLMVAMFIGGLDLLFLNLATWLFRR